MTNAQVLVETYQQALIIARQGGNIVFEVV